MSLKIRSKGNVGIEQALVAVGRAHAMMPGADLVVAKEIASSIHILAAPYQKAAVIVALVIVLLDGLGFRDAHDMSRFRVN